MGKALSPNISESTVGVIGSLPLPIPLNPVGIASAMYASKKLWSFKKDYKWFITLSELKEKSKNT